MPHGGCDEEDLIAELELVRVIMDERKKMGAKDFVIGQRYSTLSSHCKMRREELQGLDNHDWCGLDGPECQRGGEDVETQEEKLRWLQLLRDFHCIVTTFPKGQQFKDAS